MEPEEKVAVGVFVTSASLLLISSVALITFVKRDLAILDEVVKNANVTMDILAAIVEADE